MQSLIFKSEMFCEARSISSKPARLLSILLAVALIFFCLQSHAAPIYKGKTWKIMAIGDSITEGKYAQSLTGGYRGKLQTMLSNNGYSSQFVGKEDNGDPANNTGFAKNMLSGQQRNHEGYGSYRIDQMTSGVPNNPPEGHSALSIEQTMNNNNPDVVLMMLGTNDCLQIYYSPDQIGFNGQSGWAAQAAQRLNVLVGRMFTAKPNVKLVLAQISPIYNFKNSGWWYNTWTVQPYNAFIPQIVAQYQSRGYDVVMVDQWSGITVATDMADFAHPNDIGFQKMAQVWYNGLTGNTPIVSGGNYNLVNQQSGNKVVEVNGWATANFSRVDIWGYAGGANQLWQTNGNGDGSYTLVNVNSGKALDDIGWCTGGPCSTQIYQQTGGDNQRWFIRSNNDGTYTLVNKYSNLALEVTGGSSQNGTTVQQYTQNGTPAQKWILRRMN